MTTITTTIVRQMPNLIVAQLKRPAGFVLPRHATDGLLRAEIAKLLGTTPKALQWVSVPALTKVEPEAITMTFERSAIRKQADGSLLYALPSHRGNGPRA